MTPEIQQAIIAKTQAISEKVTEEMEAFRLSLMEKYDCYNIIHVEKSERIFGQKEPQPVGWYYAAVLNETKRIQEQDAAEQQLREKILHPMPNGRHVN